MGGAELGDDVALAQIGTEHTQKAFHYVVHFQWLQRPSIHAVDLHQNDEHRQSQALHGTDLQVINILENGVFAHKRAGYTAHFRQLFADNVYIHFQLVARGDNLLIEFLNAGGRLGTEVAVIHVGGVAVLLEGFVVTPRFYERVHQVKM